VESEFYALFSNLHRRPPRHRGWYVNRSVRAYGLTPAESDTHYDENPGVCRTKEGASACQQPDCCSDARARPHDLGVTLRPSTAPGGCGQGFVGPDTFGTAGYLYDPSNSQYFPSTGS